MTYREILGPQKNKDILDTVTLSIFIQAIVAISLGLFAWSVNSTTNLGLLGLVAALSAMMYVIFGIIKLISMSDDLRTEDKAHDEYVWLALHKVESDAVIAQADEWILRYRQATFSPHHARKMRRIVKLRDKAASFDIETFDENASVAFLDLKNELG